MDDRGMLTVHPEPDLDKPQRYGCPYLPCGACFSYLRVCLGQRVQPNFCPECGMPMLKAMREGN
jgi:rRNA maturation endonuclease Nob1